MAFRTEEVINYPNINYSVKEKHEEFLEGLGELSSKVSADSRYEVERNSAKLSKITSILKEAAVIDSIGKEYVGHYQRVKLHKDGFYDWVEVWISENKMVFLSSNFDTLVGLMANDKEVQNIVNTDEWWSKLSLELVDYIHSTIYLRKKAVEEKVSSILGG